MTTKTANPRTLRNAFALLSSLSAAVVGACGADGPATPPQPVPGFLSLVLRTPNSNDGALRVELAGPSVEVVEPGALRIHHSQNGTVHAILAFGDATTGTVIARIKVPDVAAAASYTGRILEAAAKQTYRQQDVAGYRFEIVRP